MTAYVPNISKESLCKAPAEGGFYIEDPLYPGQVPPVMKENPAIPVLKHGMFLTDADLNIAFRDTSQAPFSPYDVSYAVGFFFPEGEVFNPIGYTERVPLKMREGLFRPNFIVGDSWFTGRYAIRWEYQVRAEDAPRTVDTLFWVKSAGVSDKRIASPYMDLAATVVIV